MDGFSVYRQLAVATIDAVSLFRHPHSFSNYECILPDDEMTNLMITRRTVSRTLVTLGCVVLLVAAILHCFAYLKFSATAVHGSNLPIALQSVFEVAFLSMAWSWIVLALIVLVVTFGEPRLGKPIALICGFAVLIQAVFTVPMVGFFIGNEMIGAASLLIIIGCFLFHGSRVET
ncbi:MAG: hypothetical protein WBL50_27475 [Candidatus Acidiferrum sp.]